MKPGTNSTARREAGRRAAALAAAALAAAAFLSSCERKAEPAARPPRSVLVQAAVSRDFSVTEEYAARLAPSREVSVTPKVPGRVVSLGADLGQRVAARQVLFRLDPSDYDAQYRQARAALSGARAGLARTSDSGQEQQVLQAQSAADQAKVAYDNAKSLFDKTQGLFKSGAVSKQQLDDVESRYKAAGIQRDAANSALDLVKNKAGSQARDIASSQVEQARAQTDLAKSQLDAATVRSPMAGRVSYRGIDSGELVGPSTLAFVVIDDESVLAETGLSERSVSRVAAGTGIDVYVPALASPDGSGGVFRGTVDSVAPSADPRTLLYSVKVRLPNPDGALKGGMLAKLRVPSETIAGAVLVPERALFTENGGDYVFVAEPKAGGSVAVKRRVELGPGDGAFSAVSSGLAPGELVVTEGQDFLSEGDAILVGK